MLTSIESFLNIGTKGKPLEEQEVIRMYNILCYISASFGVVVSLSAWYLGSPDIYVYLVLLCTILYSTVIGINFLGNWHLARLVITIGSAIWLSLVYLCIGGFFSQSAALLVILAITYTAYDNGEKIRNKIFLFQFLTYFASMLYVIFFGALYRFELQSLRD